MRRVVVAIALVAAFNAGAAGAEPLSVRVTQADGWIAWNVPMIADAGVPCCFSGNRHGQGHYGCDLDDRNHGFNTSDDPRPPGSDVLTVYAHVDHAHVTDLRAFEASCPVRSKGDIRRIGEVAPADSIAYLADLTDGTGGIDDELALAAIAYHADGAATRVLAARAEPAHSRKDRESALFWLGQARGADGAAVVERFATTDADPKLRSHAIFALSQSHAGDPYARIQAIAQSDRNEEVRSQALFWMAQMEDARAAHDITAAVASDTSSKVREQGVFALSQLGDDKADQALIALLTGNYPRDVKKQALFWLGQSGSPRAMQYFDEALSRSK